MPSRCSRGISAETLGGRSSAIKMIGRPGSGIVVPAKMRAAREETSRTSAARAARYSSGIEASSAAWASPAAISAATPSAPPLAASRIAATKAGSLAITACMEKISLSSAAPAALRAAAISVSCAAAVASAAIASSNVAPLRCTGVSTEAGSVQTGPVALPGEPGVPVRTPAALLLMRGSIAEKMVAPAGVEPATNCLEGSCSNPLSYGASGLE